MTHPIDILVGQRLKLRRTILGLSQTEVANTIDVTFQQIQKYERGANRISASTLYRFAIALGVSVSYFFEDAPKTSEDATTAENALFDPATMSTRETLEMVRAYYRIAIPDIRRRVFELVKSLTKN